MDAKSRANFINSVASGQNMPCPKCNTLNEANSKFCASCGTPLEKKAESSIVPFASVKKTEEVKKAADTKEPVKVAKPVEGYEEPEGIFADGLPAWNIEPPQVMVRRKRK